jgi:fucose permease
MKLSYRHTAKACYLGCVTQAIAVNLAPILFVIFQDQYGLSLEQLGRLILINFTTQIIADVITTKYIHRVGYRPAALTALALNFVGLNMLSAMPAAFQNPYSGLVIAVVFYSFGSGIIEVIISPIVESLPGDEKASAMSLLHSFYCWGQVLVVALTSSFIRIFGAASWQWLPVLWACVPLFTCIMFIKVPLVPPIHEKAKTSIKTLLKSNIFLLALIMMACAGSSELTMSQWSSLFAERGLGVDKLTGDILGMCLFAALMGTGRILYSVYGHKVSLRKTLLTSSAMCVACYAITVFVSNSLISLISCALCGLSVALMWPGTLSLTAARFPLGGAAMFGVLAIGGDIGASIGPWLAGVVSNATQHMRADVNQFGLRLGLMTGMIFPLIMFIILLIDLKREKSLK